MLECWWQILAERHEEAAGSVDGGAARAAGNSPYTPRMACIRMTLRKVLDSQIENCIEAWRQQRLLAVSGGAESSESVTAQYSQCEHGFFYFGYCGHYSAAKM